MSEVSYAALAGLDYINSRYGKIDLPRIDLPGTVCAFNSNGCSKSMIGHGGCDGHHRWPTSMGGPEKPDDLFLLCPNHHRRQHSLLRYLVENENPVWAVLSHFTATERDTAVYAVAQWKSIGSPTIAGWSAPAAR